MSNTTFETQAEPATPLVGKVVGFVDSLPNCQAISRALTDLGIETERIQVIEDLEEFRHLFDGQSWGEESEEMSRAGEIEFGNGHVAICVQETDRELGLSIAEAAQSHGGYGFRHFGLLTDERLTA